MLSMKNVEPGVYETRGGKFAHIISQKETTGGRKFLHGFVLSHISHRSGLQGEWNLNGTDHAGNTNIDLVAPAYEQTESLN